MVTRSVWAVVRFSPDDGSEFVVVSEIAATQLEATMLQNISAGRVPGWHAANQVRRIARFTMTEDEE